MVMLIDATPPKKKATTTTKQSNQSIKAQTFGKETEFQSASKERIICKCPTFVWGVAVTCEDFFPAATFNPLLSTRHWPERSVDTFFCQEVQRQRLFCIISICFIYIIHGSSQKHLKIIFSSLLNFQGHVLTSFQRKKRINSPRRHEVTILPISWLLFGSKGISCATTNLDIRYNLVNKRDGPPDFFFIGRIKVLFATQHLRILHVGQTVWLHSETKDDVTGSCSVIFARPFDFGLLSGRLFLGKFPITSRVRWFLLIHSWHRFATYCSVKSFCFRLSWGGKEFQNEHLQNHQVVVCLRKCTIPYHLLLGELWLTGHVSCSKFAKPFLWIRRCHHQNLSAGEDDKQGGFKDFFVKKIHIQNTGKTFSPTKLTLSHHLLASFSVKMMPRSSHF